jgi:membrane AbrB-like protein
MTSFVGVLVAATVGGVLLRLTGLQGGLALGAMLGAAAFTIIRGGEQIPVPPLAQDAALVVLGAVIGAGVTRTVLADLRQLLVPAVIAAVAIILAGVAIALALRWFGAAPGDDVLATSPGALSAVIAIAVDRGVAPAEVALFHLVRLLMVLGTLPFVVLLLPRPAS